MKKAVISLGLMVALSPVASVFAQDDANFYLGGRVGSSQLDDACQIGSCDDNDVGGGLILGYDFGNSFSIESTYDYLGHFDASYSPTPGAISGDLTSLTLAPKLGIGITDATDLYGKIGAAWWNWDSKAGNQDDLSLLGAIGIDHRANDLVNVRLEYQYIHDMDEAYFNADNHLISAGLTFHFGRTSAPEPVMVVEEVVVVEEVIETKKYVFSEADDVELFAFGKSTLSNEATQQLNPMLKRLQDFEESTAIIIGHTDSVGSEAFNQTLSEERAQTVANYFTDNGISADRLSVVGMGEGEPVASNDTEEGRAKNRRVEIESPEFVYEE
ncbi:OmpA family protein [Enterovibrio makurazakiensis]|uniref:OmpA family protein n=1 Tax=Enterovibrio gelatinilyticus TaxID=2899819 RepID=A0ABT5QUV1_9GAMM|nr:OmpA family protein [Enterovibrio sp. ZSDZ42]MDD1791715.1 OmpA family protein [Enterovibrio sp. ZSDZ42]